MKSGCGQRAFGIFWTAFSSIFLAIGLWVVWGSISAGGWKETPCTIERFEIVPGTKDREDFRADLLYRYEVDGRSYTGSRIWRDKEESPDYEDFAEIREPLLTAPEGPLASPAGVSATCRVNPANPEESSLAGGAAGQLLFGIAFAAFGAFFVLIGLAITFAKPREKQPRSGGEGNGGTALAVIFFLIFGLAGLGLFAGLVVPKALDWMAMRSWQPTPAEVLHSRVRSHSGGDGTTYSVDIFYRYRVGDREYRSNRYGLVGGSSSGRKGKQAVVAAHPRGSSLTVFVDPERPWRAVVKRDPGWGALFALFPLPFMAVGFGGLWWLVRKRGKKDPVSRSRGTPAVHRLAGKPLAAGEWTRIRSVPLAGFVVLLVFALFWNGFIGFALRDNLQDFGRGGGGSWIGGIFSLFLLPFVLVGIALLAGVVYTFIALFGPVFELSIDESALLPGGSASLRWRRAGGRGQPRDFTLLLVGREEATYRNGSSSSTATSVFHEQVIFETTVPAAMDRGHATLVIPPDAVPTFEGTHNRIRWLICIRAAVPRLPDVRADRAVTVRAPGKEELV